MAFARWTAALALTVAACGTDDGPVSDDSSSDGSSDGSFLEAMPTTSAASDPLIVVNQGGSMEGHTPRGFAGSGTGLFAGDNLNSNFPDGDGVQLWLTFDFPAGVAAPSRAVLSSEVLSVKGRPFDDLGVLQVNPVTFDSFGPELFDLAPDGPSVDCTVVTDGRLECDVTDATAAAIGQGSDRVQFRLRFERVADADGSPDLALFFLTDSNTNEPGIFQLALG